MSAEFEDFGVPPVDCEQFGASLRHAVGCDDLCRLPSMMQVYEAARQNLNGLDGLDFVIRPDEHMDHDLAYADPARSEVNIGKTLFEKILEDEPRARFIALHELVHVWVHKGMPRFFLKREGNATYNFLAENTRAEVQADRIARAALMPPKMIADCRSDTLRLGLAARVAFDEAAKRIREFEEDKPRQTPLDIRIARAKLAAQAAGRNSAREFAEVLKLELWSRLPTIEGEDPLEYRLCENYRVAWSEFGKTTGCGWFIEKGKIVSFFGSR